jgi:uncharacterized phage protein gp47/JayE
MADTAEQIRARMLGRIPPEMDISEGSFYYDVLQAVAIELAAQGVDVDGILDDGFVLTGTGTYLDRKVAEQGITRKPATKTTGQATITGQPGTSVEVGIKVASDTALYTVTQAVVIDASTQANVTVQCDQYGIIGNCPTGAIKYFPVTITGLSAVTNTLAFTNGYDGEPDDEFRQRYLDKVRAPLTSGNINEYKNWAMEVTGVGNARVFPLWNGNGTVKVVIIDSNNQPASVQLITDVTNHIETVRPIGATVTVDSATSLAINLAVTLSLVSGYTIIQVKGFIQSNISAYFASIAFIESFISYARIGSIILGTEGVLDYIGLTVNSGTANIAISNQQVAILGTLTTT